MTHPARDPVRTGAKSALWAITGLFLLCAGVFGLFGRSE